MELSIRSEQVRIKTEKTDLEGTLCLPDEPIGVVIFANERCGTRLRRSGDYLAGVLRDAHLGTLWLDLESTPPQIGPEPPEDRQGVLVRNLRAACDWLRNYQPTAHLPLGLAGVGSGAAAVLLVAAALGRQIFALAARGAHTDLSALGPLAKISAPTLLIAGSLDERAVEKNRAVYTALRCKKRFEIVPGATRAFDEPGSLEVVARLVRSWFLQHVHQYAQA